MTFKSLRIKYKKLSIEYNEIKVEQQKVVSNRPNTRDNRHCNNPTAKYLIFITFVDRVARLILALCALFALL